MSGDFISANYERLKTAHVDLNTGTKPDVVTNTTSGSASIDYQTASGGRARLATGSTSGSQARIDSVGHALGYSDAFSLETVVSYNDTATPGGDSRITVGFHDSDGSNILACTINHATAGNRHTVLDTGAAGNVSRYENRNLLTPFVRIPIELLWDVDRSRVVVRAQNTLAVVDDITHASGVSEVFPVAQITNEVGTDMALSINQFDVHYYRRRF